MLNTTTPCPLTDQPPFTLLPPHSQAPHAQWKEAQGGRPPSSSIPAPLLPTLEIAMDSLPGGQHSSGEVLHLYDTQH